MGKKLELVGQRFGRLLVIAQGEKIKNHYHWICQCDCGNTKQIAGSSLLCGNSQSCGCLHKDVVTKHGLLNTPVHNSLNSIIQRCTNPNCKDYKRYGAKGITIAEEWRHDLLAFSDHLGPRPEDGQRYTVGRIDNTKGYIPGNVRWETDRQQTRNRGISCLNNTGHNGLTKHDPIVNGKQYHYIVAVANPQPRKQLRKYINIETYGYDEAICIGLEWREKQLAYAEELGMGYSETHGLAKGENGS